MKKSILIAIIFAILAVFFAYTYLSNLESTYRTMAEPITVVIANQKISQGSVITKEMLLEKKVPKEYVQPKAFATINNLFTKEGKSIYISLNTVEAGEQIMSTKVSRANAETGIVNIIPEGYKALAVNFDVESSNVITPGSRIDILSVIEYEDTDGKMQESIFMIAQNILVLAVGNNYLGSVAQKNDDESRRGSIITLAVTIEEAQTIMLAADNGSLKYIIRPAGDSEIYSIKPMKISDVIKDISTIAVRQKSAFGNDKEDIKAMKQRQKEALEMINKYANQK
ncbi:MAG: Flp pilus assembly protein CpaB [Endomicrobium sp.]|jgi:pilus assembly protein CpaB|nr:Flp pilus assembly protein CpaB [Endomicrobium sp.]